MRVKVEGLKNYTNLYREDVLIVKKLEKIWTLYFEGREICKLHGMIDIVGNYFKSKPRIFRELDLCEACARARIYLKNN